LGDDTQSSWEDNRRFGIASAKHQANFVVYPATGAAAQERDMSISWIDCGKYLLYTTPYI